MPKLIFDGTLEGLSTRQDKTIKVVIGTQEMNDEQLAKLFHFRSKFVKVLFSDTAIEQKEIDAVDSLPIKDESNNKSNSQRLRSVLFINWQQSKQTTNFDDYYNAQMNTIIDHFKSKLNG
jgi:hypothetical protein